jgi:hypothetical protein
MLFKLTEPGFGVGRRLRILPHSSPLPSYQRYPKDSDRGILSTNYLFMHQFASVYPKSGSYNFKDPDPDGRTASSRSVDHAISRIKRTRVLPWLDIHEVRTALNQSGPQEDEPDGSIASKKNHHPYPHGSPPGVPKVTFHKKKNRPFTNPSRGRSDRHGGRSGDIQS